jgi:hypothetical protein
MRTQFWSILLSLMFGFGSGPLPPARADAPDNSFKKAQGRMYCEANPGHPACHAVGTLTITLDPGYTIDRSYHQSALRCCGGEENGNGNSTEIPAGVYMEFNGGHDGEWGIFNIKLVADSSNVDENGVVRAWTITGDVYCGPSGAVGKGGCNANAYGWIKQKRVN